MPAFGDIPGRGQIDPVVYRAMEFMAYRTAELLSQLSEALGRPIDTAEDLGVIGGGIEFIHHGDVSLSNGNLTGQSAIPFACPPERSIVFTRGYEPGGNEAVTPLIEIDSNGLSVTATRDANVGDGVLNYTVIRYAEF